MSQPSKEEEQKAQVLQQQYNKYQSDMTDLQTQLSTISSQLQEHVIVDRTLTSIEPEKRQNRKCFKMIGGVLVEKDVDNVIKLLDNDMRQLNDEREKIDKQLNQARKNMDSWIKKHNVKIVRQ